MTTDIDAKLIEQGRKLFAGDWQFFWASPSIETLPPIAGMEVAFAGRSNVGKSSLINALTGRNALARTSHTPGRTQELIFFAGVMGADGIILAAASAHQGDAARLAPASSMLLFHAAAVLAVAALAERGIIHARIGIASAFGFVLAAALFAGDLTLRQYAGHGLFPIAAPSGGTLLIASWLAVAVAAAWPRRE